MERATEGARRPRVLLIIAALAAIAAGAQSPSGWTPAGAATAAPDPISGAAADGLGFDEASAEEAVAVHGAAAADPDFTGVGERGIDVAGAAGPFTVEAELWYQPVGYRWAHNLAGYDSAETRRFTGLYEQAAGSSATLLARASATSG